MRPATCATSGTTTPIPASSGEVTRHRVDRGGNRVLNDAIHPIALVQNRGVGPGKAFIDQRRANGKSHREAMRSLKRRLSDVVYPASSLPTCNATKPPRSMIH